METRLQNIKEQIAEIAFILERRPGNLTKEDYEYLNAELAMLQAALAGCGG